MRSKPQQISLNLFLSAVILCGLFLSCLPPASGSQEPAAEICVYNFINDECGDCREIFERYVTELITEYRLKAINLDINIPENYELLLAAEKYFNKKGASVPCALLSNAFLDKDDIIEGRLKEHILSAQGRGIPFFDFNKLKGLLSVNPPEFELKNTTAIYFYKQSCKKCGRTERDLNYLEKKYHEFNFQKFDIAEKQSCLFYQFLGERYGISENRILTTPAIFIGSEYLTEKQLYYSALESTIQKYRYQEVNSDFPEFSEQGDGKLQQKITQRFEKFSTIAVIFAGAVDGVNPCAFATMIFFVTSLLVVKRRKQEIILVGAVFIASVFFTYLAVGFGGIKLLQPFLGLPAVKKAVYIIYTAIAGGLFILSYLSMRDVFIFLRQGKDEVMLKLSDKQNSAIRNIIKEKLRVRHYLAGALISGVFVSLTELACTGQIYLPTIMYILNVPHLRRQAAAYLVCYNLAFIAPLIVIFALSLSGITALQFIRISKNNFIWGKTLLALLFTGLGIALLLSR